MQLHVQRQGHHISNIANQRFDAILGHASHRADLQKRTDQVIVEQLEDERGDFPPLVPVAFRQPVQLFLGTFLIGVHDVAD